MRCCPHCHRVWVESHEYCPADGKALRPIGAGSDPLKGWKLDGRFELIELLGSGGMGFVYLAEQIGLSRRVAVKMLYAERTKDPKAVKRFAREARALAALDHPGIVRVLDYGRGPTPYIVMELVEGPSLLQYIGGMGVLQPSLAVRVARRIAEALEAAHEQGITHRDLKPSNVHLVQRDGQLSVRILDFGLALLDEATGGASSSRLTRSGMVAGTPEYMAPEQIRGEVAGARTDLYALGVLLFESLMGAPPFVGPNPTAIVSKHLEDPVPSVEVLGVEPEVAAGLDGLVRRLLAKKREGRPASATEVVEELRALEASLPPPSLLGDPGTPRHADGTTLDIEQATGEGPAPRKRIRSEAPWLGLTGSVVADRELEQAISGARRRRRTRLVLVAAVLTLAGVISLPFLLRPEPETVTAPSALPLTLQRMREDTASAQLTVGDGPAPETDPTAPSVTTRPGGESQARYESRRRELERALAARGLRFRDLRDHPRLRGAYRVQDRAARELDFDAAYDALDALSAAARTLSTQSILDARLRAVEARTEGADPVRGAKLRALRASLDDSSDHRAATRRFLRRLDEVER